MLKLNGITLESTYPYTAQGMDNVIIHLVKKFSKILDILM